MRLIALRLQNFRQHADTKLTFDRGLTGIIGPNGSGKSTLLEAIAWALYGNTAARGTRDSIRFSRAQPRASVRVELEFELAGHQYRVVRGLTSAECFLDGGETPIANTLSGVSELLQRRLGMTRSEFFHTYFTGQKELDVMAAIGPTERARFLSRVLGYDRITTAQELVRERRRAVSAELTGLKQGMRDADDVARMVATASSRLAVARQRAEITATTRTTSAAELTRITPHWTQAQFARERAQQLLAELRVADNDNASLARDRGRVEQELTAIEVAQRDLAPLLALLSPLPDLQRELTQLDTLAAADSERQTLEERVRGLTEELARFSDRAQQLETAPALETDAQQLLASTRASLSEIELTLERERTALVRDRQEAETRLDALRTQYTDLAQQRDTLEGLGEESPCPTCGRPLGASYRGVLELLTEQVDAVRTDGNYYRQRVEQLKKTPEAIAVLEEQRRTAQAEIATVERRLNRIQSAITELSSNSEQRTQWTARLTDAQARLLALATGYNANRHATLRREMAQLADASVRAARLGALVDRDAPIRAELARITTLEQTALARQSALLAQREALPTDEAEYTAMRDQFERATVDARNAELEALSAAAEVERMSAEMESAERERRELARLQEALGILETERRLHDELDRAFTDLRTDLNFQLRPELAEIASRFLDVLTDGRYNALEFDEDYNLLVLEDGLPKTVISGGEEDLCNLVLRLAISQMIAERAGQAFSLLILDEVFGSLDETRRGNVVELLRRLNDRFEQVIVITHIEQVREGLDRVLVVRFDEERGTSVVTSGTDMVLQ